MVDLRFVSAEVVRTMHITLFSVGLSRLTLFTLIYLWHLWVPLFGLLVFMVFPTLRPAISLFIALVLLSQFLFKTCVIAKLEWKVMPEAEGVTWTTADIGKVINVQITKTVRFWWMVWCTSCALVSLYVIHRLMPDGLFSLSGDG